MTDRKKLETEIEKEVFKMVRTIKDHTRDFTVLKVRKARQQVDGELLDGILTVVEQAIMDGFHQNINRFMKNLDSSLEEFTSEQNPLPPTEKPKKQKK